MFRSILHHNDLDILKYIVTHVFLPLQLPDGDDHSIQNDYTLAGGVASAAHLYLDHLDTADVPQWHSITSMLDNLHTVVQFEGLDKRETISQLSSMNVGDVRAFPIRAQNAAIIIRKRESVTIFESFEVSPKAEGVMSSQGKLLCSYPGPAIEIPTAVFDDDGFLAELVNFLVHMNNDVLDAAPTTQKAKSTVHETRDTTHPRYITELLTGILRGVGSPADIVRICKRVGDDVAWNNSKLPWRRSSLWLLIRVALQTSIEQSSLGHHTYKSFILFFMCCIAKERICANLSNDFLHAISAKLSRRLRKLGSTTPDWFSHAVSQTCTSIQSTLEGRWRQVQEAQRASPCWAPTQLNLAQDIRLSLPKSGSYIRSSLANQATCSSSSRFDPKHRRRGSLDDFLSSDGQFFQEAYRSEPHLALYDVERLVEQGIDAWVRQVTNNDKACEQLQLLACNYSSNALNTYENKPEFLSIMLLTTIELWIALDKIVIKEIPMLSNYSPELPIRILEDLLLHRKGNLDRLRCAHQYLSRRHAASKSGWSVFSPTVDADSFSVRFYRKSSHLQDLKAQIEETARGQVEKKVAELKKACARHIELTRKAEKLEHEYGISRRGWEYHARDCEKCGYEKESKKMQINVHEWPLPAAKLRAEALVFELNCPVSFNMWRSATFHLLVDLCTPSTKSTAPYIELSAYTALRSYFVKHPRSRISLASDTKPFVVTHYNKLSIPTSQERVCVPSGLTWYGFDSGARVPIARALGCENISKYCTYRLQSGPYRNLQNYVGATSHTSNQVLANQSDCDKDISIHEFIAFGHLRAGCLVQWLNILRELRGRSLSFHRSEVYFLLAQAISQVGPFADMKWTWHQEIEQPLFCNALLEEVEKLLLDVQANWLEVVTMDTISFLVRRLLASSVDQGVLRRACGLLRSVRSKVFSWVEELSDKLAKAQGDEEFRGLLRDAAAVCRGTFDVNPAVIPQLLSTKDDVKILLSSAILIHHHTPPNVSTLSSYSQLLLDRDRRLSLVLESVVSDVIQADSSDQGINLAVGWIWPDYRPGSKWTPLQSPNSRWLSCETAPTENQNSQLIYLNLLDGSLLVDGKSLGRLPSEIHSHPLYGQIFGKQVLEIVPADLPGMDYSTRGRISGHRVYFTLKDKSLKIQAMTAGSSKVMELIPAEKLAGDLPAVLVEGHVHWLNLSTSVMEIRPIANIWESPSESWKVDCTQGRFRMNKGNDSLVDTGSKSWDMVSSLLQPLESSKNLIVIASQIHSGQPLSPLRLSVLLPRYRLSFYVNEDGDLESYNIRGMIYDKNQSIGALFGLVNLLVLRPKHRNDVYADELDPRHVLIPEGDVSFRRYGHHARIEINIGGSALQRLTYQTYRVNTDLGCLVGNASITSKLFCAYLHALSSGFSTDPLTGRSGTEEALSLLQSAGCWSIMKFSSRDAELLCLIAHLCPSRTWYPKHLKHMQKVEWLNLPVHSQHHGLYVACKAIKEHYERVQLFHEDQTGTFEDFPVHDDHLLERSARRAAYVFPGDLYGQLSRANCDVRYAARDLVEDSSGEQRAYTAATLVYYRRASPTSKKNIVLTLLNSWTGTVSGKATLSLQYDRSWLAPDPESMLLEAYNLLRKTGEGKWFKLLFSLPAMAFASSQYSDLVNTFVAFATDSRFRSEDPPGYSMYLLPRGYEPPSNLLDTYVSDCAVSFELSPEGDAPARAGESEKNWRKRQLKMYNDRLSNDTDSTVRRLLIAWPCETPPRCTLNSDLYDITKLTSNVQSLFSSCYHNLKLKQHFNRVQVILNDVHSQFSPSRSPRYSFDRSQIAPIRVPWPVSMCQLLMSPPPSLPTRSKLPRVTMGAGSAPLSEPSPLRQVIATIEGNTTNDFERRYLSALDASAGFFESEVSCEAGRTVIKLPTIGVLEAHYDQCKTNYATSLERLKQHLGPRDESQLAVEQSGQWPRVTAHALFRCLASNSPIKLSDNWKGCIIRLALLALELQRARRLLRLRLNGLDEELRREMENEGCDGWDPEDHPDWLLIQLQCNFLVRRVQAEVAHQMMAPSSGSNTATQLNMGEGKSSVIVPIVTADLADGDQLVRVIVPKALTAQMFQLLADRLGGLASRRIYVLPFSRSLQVDHRRVTTLQEIMSECMKERGILVVQPEHVLSLRLVSVEKQLPGDKDHDARLAASLLKLQKWLHSHSRDILDESDEVLHVRYQLVYTIGRQQPMEGFPERWTTTQQILSLAKKYASSLQEPSQFGIEYEHGPSGSFPHLRVLNADAGQKLIVSIAEDVITGLLPNLGFGQLPPTLKEAIRCFISRVQVSRNQVKQVRKYAQQTPVWTGLLLLRGLLATGILLFAFRERRWRVDYGLARSTRTMLAVPYRAKDVPSQRAEFGHPDVAIVLTCLSYYYGGLSEEQLRLSFDILLKQDDPTLDYDLWVRECPDMPESLRTLNGVNIKSLEQWNKSLFPLFSRNKATIDFYLSSIVFPKEAKEFPYKLSCSGWDLAEKKERLLTGFSGTNDGQHLLPLHIKQCDPDHQRGTNAKVLSYLLQPENKFYMCMTRENGERRTTREFLDILVTKKPEIRVLLDVGAQMLDMKNDELAETWLEINLQASAAIYFSDDDELTVRTRDGSTQLLLSSPFAQQLDQCVVYLDDAHTRGTDIKFPSGFRAAVTLGPKVTKDRLVQGCMRMRKLGHNHSIMFFAPLEVDRRIRAVAGVKKSLDGVNTADILHWAIRETCQEVEQRAPHWAQQGMDHTSRYDAWTGFCGNRVSAQGLSDQWLQPEAKKLEALYAPRGTSGSALPTAPDIRQRCIELGVLSLRDVSMDEEQEREVIHEVELERQVERPPKAKPASHSIHPDVTAFVKTGIIPTSSTAFHPVMKTLDTTSAATDEAHVWSSSVLVTADFRKTVGSSGKSDEYLRPVQWIVSRARGRDKILVILSPYEVNQLMPQIRSGIHVHLHLYTPRVTRSMKPCDDLSLYSIPDVSVGWKPPSSLMNQLSTFAGQLYLKDYETYIQLCRFLCVYARDLQDEEGMEVGCDGFISPKTRPIRLWSIVDTFQSSPMNSLRILIGLRRKGMRFSTTHMGKLVSGRQLSEDDFDDYDDYDMRHSDGADVW